jgi:hypothetical protein
VCSEQKCAEEEETKSLKMILSTESGSRFQMDLVEMPYFNGYNYILRVVDHLSKFGYVYPLKTKTSEEVGKTLLCILATSIMPRILQSDNGGEVRFFNLFSFIITIFPCYKNRFFSFFFRIFFAKKPY